MYDCQVAPIDDRETRPASRAAEGGLHRAQVIAEAMRLADAEGVEGLSMRKLASSLGAGAMSLYHYVANKSELLDAMADVVFAEIDLPEGDDWRAALRRRSTSARAVLARHPWAVGVLESRVSPGPENLRHREAVTACLRRAGFSPVMATHANWLLDSYVYGFALQEATLPFASADDLSDMTEAVYLPQLPQDRFPYLHESAAALMEAGFDPAEQFAFGLDLILDGLEPMRGDPSPH